MRDQKPAIQVRSVSQIYKLYPSPAHMMGDVLGLYRARFWKKKTFPTHQALTNVSLEINRGERVGIVGRNGAGKTTLLKVITQNYQPTSGEVSIHGRIQSLMDQGVGFHPDFTGRQNIRSAMIYNGILGEEIERFEREIIEFVELGEFIDQPIKTYSLGMKARLGFAAATAIKPDILIVDEVLGAGDAYFASKSAARMKRLTSNGVTLVLVSHSNAQILQFCDRVVWMEKGRIVADGPALEVIKAYDKFIVELENEHLNKVNTGSEETGGPGKSGSFATVQMPEVTKWNGSGELVIEKVVLKSGDGSQRSVFKSGQALTVNIAAKATKSGRFPCLANVFFYTGDGRPVCQFTSKEFTIDAKAGDQFQFDLAIDSLLLGNGEYVFTPALYSKLDYSDLGTARFYDLVDRSFPFRVFSDYEGDPSLFIQPAMWHLKMNLGGDTAVETSEAALNGRVDLGESYRRE